MIAYNRQSLDNLEVQRDAKEALESNLLTVEEYDRIRAAYPFHFYLPDFFIRIGLFVLTVIAAACGLGILVLMDIHGSSGPFLIVIFYSLLAYSALELFIRVRKMYGSGVDDALLWVASLLILVGINMSSIHFPLNAIPNAAIVLAIALFGTLRYSDRGMALVAYTSFLCLIFYSVSPRGLVAKELLPFIFIAISIGCYLLFTRLHKHRNLRHYRSCLLFLRMAALLSLYAAGNYFIVREANEMLSGRPGPVAFAWLWWLLTGAIPVFYIVRGVQRKDVLFLWTGMALTALSVFTVRYYYHLLPAEIVMIIGGILLFAGAYGLIHYLRKPRNGFTSAAGHQPHPLASPPVEGLIIAETFSTVPIPPADGGVRFGGGTTGGGGAGGQY